MAPLSSDGSGQLLNTNADSIAAHVAIALAENSSFQVSLNLCFDLEGVMVDGKLCEVFSPQDFKMAKKDKQVSGGMIPKLDVGFMAVQAGVSPVRIVHPKDLYTQHSGTYLQLD